MPPINAFYKVDILNSIFFPESFIIVQAGSFRQIIDLTADNKIVVLTMPFSTIRLRIIMIVCLDHPVVVSKALVSSIKVIDLLVQRQLTIFHSESVKRINNHSSTTGSCLPVYSYGRQNPTKQNSSRVLIFSYRSCLY